MPRVHLQTERMGLLRRRDEALQFPGTRCRVVKRFRECARVEFDKLTARAARGFDLARIRSDEEADLDAGIIHFAARLSKRPLLCDHVQSAFGRYFLTPLRDQADDVRLEFQSNIENLEGVGHFEVKPGS